MSHQTTPASEGRFVDLGRVIVEHRDGRFERVATDEEA